MMCDLVTRISWRRAWASEASEDSDGVDDVPLHLGLGVSSSFQMHSHGSSAGGRPGTRGSSGGGGFVVIGGGGGRSSMNNGLEERGGGQTALPSILATGAAMAGDDSL